MANNTITFESNFLSVVEFDILARFPFKQVSNPTPIQSLFYLEHSYWEYIDNYAKTDKENQFPHVSFDDFVKKGTKNMFLNLFHFLLNYVSFTFFILFH